MPAGKSWLQRRYDPAIVPTAQPLFHVFRRQHGPLSANPWSEGRFALASRIHGESSDYGMFYVATTVAGALWEVPLREVQPEDRIVSIPLEDLKGLSVVTLELVQPGVQLLELSQPGLRALFPDVKGPETAEIARLRETGCYEDTHDAAWELQRELIREGHPMPFLAWPSRMHNASTVYLGYQPPMEAAWWNIIEGPTDLDGPKGHELVRTVLAEAGYAWLSIESDATDPDEDAEG